MLVVSCGAPGDGRADHLFDEAVERGPFAGALHVVRTGPRRDALVRRAEARRGATSGTLAVTFDDLVRDLAARRREARRRLDAAGRRLVVEELARAAPPPLVRGPSLGEWLSRLFSVLKRAGVFGRRDAETRFPSVVRGAGAAAALDLFDAYTRRLIEGRLYDLDGLAFEVARDLGTAELPHATALGARTRLVVEGFYRTAPVERRVFERLFEAYPETIWVMDADDDPRWDAPGASIYGDARVGDEVVPGDATWLRGLGAAFRGAEACAARPAPRAFVYADERTEARAVAARVRAIRAERPTASILVVAPSDREAAPLFEEAFAEAGLDLAVGAARPAAETATAQALFALLDLAAEDFPRAEVVSAVRGVPDGFAFGPPGARLRLRAAVLERAARGAAIFGGRAQWTERLAAAASDAEAEAARASGGEDELAARRARRAADEAALVRDGVAALFDAVGSAAGTLDAARFVARVADLVADVGLLRPAAPLDAAFDAVEMRAAAREAAAADALRGCLDAYRRAAAALVSDELPWEEHVSLFRLVVADAAAASPPVARDAARLVGLRDVRGLSADDVFVCGVTERDLPERGEAPPLLDERDAARAGARTRDARRREAEALLLHAAAAARREATFSRPARVARAPTEPPDAWESVFGPLPFVEVAVAETTGRRAAAARVARTARARDAEGERDAWEALRAAGAEPALAAARANVEIARIDPDRVGRFEGVLEAAALPALRDLAGAAETPWSSSRFDDFLACPLRYFFKRVLRIAVADDPDRDVTPLERGDVLHRVLYDNARAPLIPGEDAENRLLRIAEEACAATGRRDAFGDAFLERLTGGLAGRPGPTGPLKRFLEHEAGRRPEFAPRFFEARIGSAPRGGATGDVLSADPAELIEPAVGGATARRLRFAGAVDRIDVALDGEVPEAYVIDYKAGDAAIKSKDALAGRTLQVFLYAAVLPDLLARALGRSRAAVVGAGYFGLGAKTFGLDVRLTEPGLKERLFEKSKRRPAIEDGEFPRRVATAVRRAFAAVDAIAAGRFHPHRDPADRGPCAACDFAAGCRGESEGRRLAASRDPALFATSALDDGAAS